MINKFNNTFTQAQIDKIKADILDMHAQSPFLVTLGNEGDDLQSVDDERYPYVDRTVKIHAVNHPNLVSGFHGTTAEATSDWTFVNQADSLIPLVEEFLTALKDSRKLAAAESYEFMRGVYGTSQDADAAGVAGAKEVVDDLSPLFAGQGPKPAPQTP